MIRPQAAVNYTRSACSPCRHSVLRSLLSRPCPTFPRRRTLSTPSSSTTNYSFERVEKKWRDTQVFGGPKTTPSQSSLRNGPKFYPLVMFPYPSGALHMGHVRVYTIADVIARFKQLQGFRVLHPMGWDAFGLPAENAAIQHGVHPEDWTKQNIVKMKEQLKAMGTAFDWGRELSTCDPAYYRWTQQLFLKLHKKGLVYQKEALVNWDPVDQTVLANEQVDANGRAERSGALVEKRYMKQWFIKITAYAEQLLQDLEHLDWPDRVKKLQTNWIGKTEGHEVELDFDDQREMSLVAFVPDGRHLEDMAYIAVSPTAPPFSSSHKRAIEKVMQSMKTGADGFSEQATGAWTGLMVVNPVTERRIPVYVVSNVEVLDRHIAVGGYPTAVEADAEFARRYKIPFDEGVALAQDRGTKWQSLIQDYQARRTVHYRLRDWLVSRQRYWGTPIPFVHCDTCGPIPVPESDLPVTLPPDAILRGKDGEPSPDSSTTTTCPVCSNQTAHRDPDTMDTFVDSSWYWLRYCSPTSTTHFADPETSTPLLPVDIYVGGAEHSILHLLYARFIAKFLTDIGVVHLPRGEPFQRLLTQGMVQGLTYRDAVTQRYLKPTELDLTSPTHPTIKATGATPLQSYEKMSKSKHNGVEPAEILERYGVDATRLYVLYKAAPGDDLMWEERAVVGMGRWVGRVWRVVEGVVVGMGRGADAVGVGGERRDERREAELNVALHTCIKEVTTALTETYHFHVAVASLIKLTHSMEAFTNPQPQPSSPSSLSDPWTSPTLHAAARDLIVMMAPFAPCVAQELWEMLGTGGKEGEAKGLFAQDRGDIWPKWDESILNENQVICAIMINGKTRGTFPTHPSHLHNTALLEQLARDSPTGRKYLVDPVTGEERRVRKVVVGGVGKGRREGVGRVVSFVL
ncbi:leucyl-tRNA synthetase [Fimicolochytrium jonesii]|uniref:leucyl-tRNA synthetase n=1 Tax=Fimicolochytrium jonesii TaxID=1396493 RepID=UPI0022FDF563|nr:leucyl-tRNA synthetase [Fimicolochytrium jonesii]KAI8816148.1 leucyl-tRNA synthetase [Fimicolochytrium jonesii]